MNFQLMIAGTVLFGIGVVILLLGKRSERSVDELVGAGRTIYDDLDAHFERPNVVLFKILSYAGMGIVLFSIGLFLFEMLG